MSDPKPASEEQMLWTQPEWLAEVRAWIGEHAEITGELEQPHIRHWSTVLRVPTNEGDLWFKAVAPIHHFEPELTALLARLRPGRVPEVVALESERAWMLMRDGGTRLRELVQPPAGLDHWEQVLPGYAELQIGLAPYADELLGLGVPDERLAGLRTRLEVVFEDPEPLLLDRPEGLTSDEYRQILERLPEVELLCEQLAAYGIPETIQHDDLHDGQVFVRDGRYLVFDWGDACVSHPFHTLTVLLRAIAWKFGLEPGARELVRLRDTYLEPFGSNLADAADLAYRTGTLARALAWHRFVAAREPELRCEDAEGLPYGLKLFLEGKPIGAWE